MKGAKDMKEEKAMEQDDEGGEADVADKTLGESQESAEDFDEVVDCEEDEKAEEGKKKRGWAGAMISRRCSC